MQTLATLVQIGYYVRKSFSYSLLFIFVINFHIANIVNFFKKVKNFCKIFDFYLIPFGFTIILSSDSLSKMFAFESGL